MNQGHCIVGFKVIKHKVRQKIKLKKVDLSFFSTAETVFPGIQGGALMHAVAGKAAAFGEALKPEFKLYQEQVIKNAKAMADTLKDLGLPIISGGTDNHLMIADISGFGTNGRELSDIFDTVNITLNKNTIPFDKGSAAKPSGIRMGTPAVTSRGFKEAECVQIAHWIKEVISNRDNRTKLDDIKSQIIKLCDKYPIYK